MNKAIPLQLNIYWYKFIRNFEILKIYFRFLGGSALKTTNNKNHLVTTNIKAQSAAVKIVN